MIKIDRDSCNNILYLICDGCHDYRYANCFICKKFIINYRLQSVNKDYIEVDIKLYKLIQDNGIII